MKVWFSGEMFGIGFSLIEELDNSIADKLLIASFGDAAFGLAVEIESQLGVEILRQGGVEPNWPEDVRGSAQRSSSRSISSLNRAVMARSSASESSCGPTAENCVCNQ